MRRWCDTCKTVIQDGPGPHSHHRYRVQEIQTVTGSVFAVIDGNSGQRFGSWLFRDEAEKVATFRNFIDN
jgi:hypothetical protein